MKRLNCTTLCISLFCVLGPSQAQAAEDIPVGSFSQHASIEAAGWKPLYISERKPKTVYKLVDESGTRVLEAAADKSFSALTHVVDIDPNTHPVIHFRWKVDSFPNGSDLKKKSGDDFAARVYVLFDYDTDKLGFGARTRLRIARSIWGDAVPTAALNYVWDTKYPVGTTAWNAFTDRARMIVVESGDTHKGQWVSVTRNVAQDFKAAFGGEAPGYLPHIIGVAIATDADNTQSTASASYGDITFASK
jgi:Protein of unknown function (DUF3047)